MSVELKQTKHSNTAHGCAQCRSDWFRAAVVEGLLWHSKAATTSLAYCGACSAAWSIDWKPDADGGEVSFRPVSSHPARLS